MGREAVKLALFAAVSYFDYRTRVGETFQDAILKKFRHPRRSAAQPGTQAMLWVRNGSNMTPIPFFSKSPRYLFFIKRQKLAGSPAALRSAEDDGVVLSGKPSLSLAEDDGAF